MRATKGKEKNKKKPSCEILISEYRHDCRIQGLSSWTIDTRTYALEDFARFMKERDIHLLDIERDDMKAFLEYLRIDRGITGKSIQNFLTHINGFYDYLTFENYLDSNPITIIRKRYRKAYKDYEYHTHKIISTKEMSDLIHSAVDIRDRCLMALMAKTGIRRKELISLDASDVDFNNQCIMLKITAKRSNRIVYFDNEMEILLKRWLKARETRNRKWPSPALFLSQKGGRLERKGVDGIVSAHAQRLGLDNRKSEKLEDHFTPHCFRHWNTTVLIRAGMPRDFVKELRGDVRREAIDVYNHIDPKDLRESYIACMPRLGLA